MSWVYLVGLLLGLAGMATLDWRYKLAFWHAPKRAALVIILTVLFFVVWDALGIFLGIFYYGHSPYSLGILLAPEFPLEELFFLILLSYCTLVCYRGAATWPSRT